MIFVRRWPPRCNPLQKLPQSSPPVAEMSEMRQSFDRVVDGVMHCFESVVDELRHHFDSVVDGLRHCFDSVVDGMMH